MKKTFVFFVLLSASFPLFAQGVRPDTLEVDSRLKRVPVTGELWIARTIHEKDEDWFSFTAPANAIMIAETEGSLDTVMALFDGVSRVEINDDVDESGNSQIRYPVEQGVTYTVLVYGYDHEKTGAYRFRIRMEEDVTEPNDTMQTAYTVKIDEKATGYIYPAGDEDWYALAVQT
ncbi:MAG: hypothetical protein LBJ31_00580, partial [Treponema sp.]|nr:hypothetical protein [Treponema sp.]